MQYIIDSIFIIIGIIIYLKHPKWIIFYWFSLEPIFLPIIAIVTKSFSYEQFYELVGHLKILGRNFFIFLIFIEWLRKSNRFPKMGIIYTSFIVLTIYLTLINIITHFSFNMLWGNISELLSLILPLIFLIQKKEARPSVRQIITYIKLLLTIEIIATILNLLGIYVYAHFYVTNFLTTNTGELIEIDDSNLVSGTFSRYNALANCLTTLYLFISLEYFSNKTLLKPYIYHFISLIFFGMVIFSGAKVSLILLTFIYLINCTYYHKQHLKAFFVSWITTLCVAVFILSFNNTFQNSSGGLSRQIEGLSAFAQTDKDDDNQSTVGLSFYLLNNYFHKAPLIGNNISYKGEYAYGNRGVCTLSLFKADARVAFQIVEFGIIGTFLYLLFFISIFLFLANKIHKNERVKLFICFLYYLLLTITEGGFFDRTNLPLVFIYAFCILTPRENFYIAENNNS